MKKNLIIILMALLSGFVVISIIFLMVNKPLKEQENMITVFQVGVFKNEVNALAEAKKYKGIVHKEKNYYRVYIAAYQNDEIIAKMKSYYESNGISIYLKKVKVSQEYLNTINKYENLLQNSNDQTIYANLNELLISKLEEYL